jgi:phage gpG-like protein
MIDVQVTGTLPTIEEQDWQAITEEVGDVMLDAVRMNFIEGGRPDKWQPLKSGEPSFLFRSGNLLNSIQKTTGEEDDSYWAQVSTTGGLPYAEIHQYGGVIQHPGSTKAPIPMMINGEMTFRWMKDPFNINVPPRPFMELTEEDVRQIMELAAGRLVTILNEKGEPIGSDRSRG